MTNDNSIDEEFTSLFLGNLQNTRANSVRDGKLGIDENGRENQDIATSEIENENENYVEDIVIPSCDPNINNQKPYSGYTYTRYLPYQTTFPLDSWNHEEHLKTANCAEPNQEGDKNEDDFSEELVVSTNVTNKSCPIVSAHSAARANEYNSATNLSKEHEDHNLSSSKKLIYSIMEKMLKLQEMGVPKCEASNLSFVKHEVWMSGRIFINHDSFKSLINQNVEIKASDYSESTQLICYRRNYITLEFSLNLENMIKIDPHPFDKISIHLYTILEKIHNKKGSRMISEDFVFDRITTTHTTTSIRMSKSNEIFKFEEISSRVKKGQKIVNFNWGQIRFNSASANNFYDLATNNHKIRLEVKYLDSNDNCILKKNI